MANRILIKDVQIVNEGRTFNGGVLIEGEYILKVYDGEVPDAIELGARVIDGKNRLLMPGVIDDQVHFRDPGLTHKGDIATESRAAVAGGTTSFMEMPNTKPQATSLEVLEQKYQRASEVSMANYSFYFGATNDNLNELVKVDPKRICGVKVFMGSSTGNMLVDNEKTLEGIFSEAPTLITTHCEDEATVKANLQKVLAEQGDQFSVKYHPYIRSAEACYKSSSKAVELAAKHGARLHILHLSTAKELELFETKPIEEKLITAEVCVHHLWFDETDYALYGNRIKWNPAIKSAEDREGLIKGLIDGKLDVVATDHAPHLPEEKSGIYQKAASGGPMVQHSLTAMLELARKGRLTKELVVEKMCHAPAKLYGVINRGFIREGYFADLVVVDPAETWTVMKSNIHYKCGWSPMEGTEFRNRVDTTIINGQIVYNDNCFDEDFRGQRLFFNR